MQLHNLSVQTQAKDVMGGFDSISAFINAALLKTPVVGTKFASIIKSRDEYRDQLVAEKSRSESLQQDKQVLEQRLSAYESAYPGVLIRPYTIHPLHALLVGDATHPDGPNIGDRGENLTITFLNLNRSALSKKLCRSIADHIPEFAGEVLAVDNGSSEDELNELREFMQTMPFRYRLEELGRNFGVSGGRNRAVAQARTPWIMSLDNDLYFFKNPLKRIQSNLAELGCHFMTLAIESLNEASPPLHGGHLWVSQTPSGDILVSGGAAYPSSEGDEPGGLGTFLAGTGSVFHKKSFEALGGFDENMFVGFEDTEFSLRLFRAGMKVGSDRTPALIHDHPKPTTEAAGDYETRRFSHELLVASAKHFESVYGLKIWSDGVAEWLKKRREEIGLKAREED